MTALVARTSDLTNPGPDRFPVAHRGRDWNDFRPDRFKKPDDFEGD